MTHDDEPPLASLPSAHGPSPEPQGRRTAYVGDAGGRPQVWIAEVGDGRPRLVDTGPDPVQAVQWSPDGRWLAVLSAPAGGCLTQVHVVRPDGGGLRRIGGGAGVATFLGRWSPEGATLAVTESDSTGRGGRGTTRVSLVDAASGSAHQVDVDGLLSVLDVDRDGGRLLLRRGPRGRREVLVVDVRGGVALALLAHDPGVNTDLGRFSPDGRTAYVRSDALSDMPALLAVPVPAGPEHRGSDFHEVVLLAGRPDAELEHFDVSRDGRTLALVWNASGRSDLELLDVADGTRSPGPAVPAPVVTACAFSADTTRLAVAAEGPAEPSQVWVAGVDDRRFAPAPRHAPRPTVAALEPSLVRFPADDGLEVSGWLYDARGPGGAPGPALVWLHGGPEAQERPGFAPLHQALVRAGVSVLAANVRGSSGFGRAYVEADNLERRFAAIDDVAACVRHLVSTAVADPDRVGCAGRSYGGWLTLAALVTHPELFAVGVDVCGMVDFASFYARTEPWIAAAAVSEYGSPDVDGELLRALSPLHRMDRLVAPLLVVHGDHDTNVPLHEAEQTLAAARAAGVPTRYLLFEGEGHELARTENRVRFVAETVAWVRAHLGAARVAA